MISSKVLTSYFPQIFDLAEDRHRACGPVMLFLSFDGQAQWIKLQISAVEKLLQPVCL